MKAWTVVGPTNRQPRRFSSFERAIDAGVVELLDASLRPLDVTPPRVAPAEP